jgi:hypothetical protein
MSVDRLASKVNVDLINPKNNLLKSQKFSDILALLKQKIAEYPPNHILKQCNEFLLYVCKIVEEVVVKGDKINKKEFVIDLFKQLFSLNEPESKLVSSSIDFLWSNGLISKIKTSKKLWNMIKKAVSSKSV